MVDGVAKAVQALVMLETIKVGSDLVPGVGMVLSLDQMLMGLASISADSDTKL